MERLCAIRKLGWKKVEVEKVKVLKKDIPNLLIQYNKQRVKTSWEILNEYHLLGTRSHISFYILANGWNNCLSFGIPRVTRI